MSNNEVIVLEQKAPQELAVNITDKAVAALSVQREQLKKFVASQLKEGLSGDYAKIPGTGKKTLLKPGAEKLANIFQLGSRIVEVDKDIDTQKQFAMYTYTVEVFHIPTGKAIAQCQGSANSLEKTHQKRGDFAFSINSIQKMAQKRAFVGAVISATGASDFFTQDMEDALSGARVTPEQPEEKDGAPLDGGYRVPFGKFAKKALEEIDVKDHRSYIAYLEGEAKKKNQELSDKAKEYIERASDYIAAIENGSFEEFEVRR